MTDMAAITAEEVTLSFGSMQLTGAVLHRAETQALVFSEPAEPDMVISTNLSAYGLEPQEDTVFIKDWTEHEGLTDSLFAAGVIEIVRKVFVGPFNSPAYEVRILK